MQRTTKIFVDGLREELVEQDLRLYFGRFGPVNEVLIIRELSEVIGYGFVTFQSSDSVEQIISINQIILNGSVLRIQKVFSDVLGAKPTTPKTPTNKMPTTVVKSERKSFKNLTPYSRNEPITKPEAVDTNRPVPIQRSNSTPTLNIAGKLLPISLNVKNVKTEPNDQPQTSASVIQSDNQYVLTISSLKQHLPALESLYSKTSGKASATEPMKLIRLIETIKGNIKITLKELMELESIILQLNDPTLSPGPPNNTLKEISRKILMNGMNMDTTELDLRTYFGAYGNIIDVVLMGDKNGHGFVTFENENAVDKIMLKHNHVINMAIINIQKVIINDFIQPKSTSPNPVNIKTEPRQEEACCPICLDSLKEIKNKNKRAMSTICGHLLCSQCCEMSFSKPKKVTTIDCFECKKKLKKKDLINIFFV